jgi:hypothetical protein
MTTRLSSTCVIQLVHVLPLTISALLVFWGCQTPEPKGGTTPDGGRSDVGPNDDTENVDGSASRTDASSRDVAIPPAKPCETDFDTILSLGGSCISTYEGEIAYLRKCSEATLYRGGSAGPCGDLLAANVSWGTHGHRCFYDAESGEWVGTTVIEDIPSFCDDASHNISTGKVADCPTFVPTDLDIYCDDSSFDDDAGRSNR